MLLCHSDVDAWLSLVERCVRDAEVAGSNPVASIFGRGAGKLGNRGFPVLFLLWGSPIICKKQDLLYKMLYKISV